MADPVEAITSVVFPPAALAFGAKGLMGGSMDTPKPETVAGRPTPPQPDDADTKARMAAAALRERGRRRASGSILTQPGALGQAPVSVKSLLGQ